MQQPKEKICSLKLDSFKGHDIIKMSMEYQDLYDELDNASQYDHELTLVMLSEIIKANGENENFLYKLRPLKDNLSAGFLAIQFLVHTKAKE